MEHVGSSSNAPQNQPSTSGGSPDSSEKKVAEEEVFVNHAEIAWHQMRSEWVGNWPRRLRRPPGFLAMLLLELDLEYQRWPDFSLEDMLESEEPFPRRIPLAEVVKRLIPIWRDKARFESDDIFSMMDSPPNRQEEDNHFE